MVSSYVETVAFGCLTEKLILVYNMLYKQQKMTTIKQVNLLYAINVPIPFLVNGDDAARIVLLPSDHPTLDTTNADFEFELDYEDTTYDIQIPDSFTQPWMKFFMPIGFVPPPTPPSSPANEPAFPRALWERNKPKCIDVPVTTRVWFWRQVPRSLLD